MGNIISSIRPEGEGFIEGALCSTEPVATNTTLSSSNQAIGHSPTQPTEGSPAKQSGFLRLPPELRNHIYTLVLPMQSLIEVDIYGPAFDDRLDVLWFLRPWLLRPRKKIVLRSPDTLQPALLQVNRQIRKETVRIYYGSNTFRLCRRASNVWGRGWLRVKMWLRANEKHLSRIPELHIGPFTIVAGEGRNPACQHRERPSRFRGKPEVLWSEVCTTDFQWYTAIMEIAERKPSVKKFFEDTGDSSFVVSDYLDLCEALKWDNYHLQ